MIYIESNNLLQIFDESTGFFVARFVRNVSTAILWSVFTGVLGHDIHLYPESHPIISRFPLLYNNKFISLGRIKIVDVSHTGLE